jgi:methionyl-tRNA formyltransferase
MGKAKKKATPSPRKRKIAPRRQQVHHLEAVSLTTASPRLGKPSLRQIHQLQARSFVVGGPNKVAKPRGRRRKLTPKQIEDGIELRKRHPEMLQKEFCNFLRDKQKLKSDVANAAIYRWVISKVPGRRR